MLGSIAARSNDLRDPVLAFSSGWIEMQFMAMSASDLAVSAAVAASASLMLF